MNTLLAIAAWMLGLSLLVQVVQDVWKFFTNSKARSFEAALTDLLGPSLVGRLQQDRRLAVRGPMQFRRVGRAGYVLPAAQDELMRALENAAPQWHLGLLRALQQQRAISGTAEALPARPLRDVIRGIEASAIPEASAPFELLQFLKSVGVTPGTPFNADRVYKEYWTNYFAHLLPLAQNYPQLIRNFEYAYERKNLKQSFVIGFLVALLFNLPFHQVYERAAATPPAEAMKMAADAAAAYARAEHAGDAEDVQELRVQLDQALTVACGPTNGRGRDSCYSIDYLPDPNVLIAHYNQGTWSFLRFLFGCLLTALLISFGAPFWNDLLSGLGRTRVPAKKTTKTEPEE